MASGSERHPSRSRNQPTFWKELYWFSAICLAGVSLALAVVPPRASRYRSLLELEGRLTQRKEMIQQQGRELEAATISMQTDPFYREAVYRKVLGVKKNGEEFLELPGPVDR